MRRIVFLSAPLKTGHPFFQQPNPMRRVAERVEALIAESGFEWTFLRPGMFAANALRVVGAFSIERDIAAVAVRALCEHRHAGAEYVLTGPESLTQAERLSTIGRAAGRPVRVEEISPEQARRELTALMPAPVIDMLLSAWAAGAGRPALVTSTVAEITGAPARSFFDWAAGHAAEFGA